MQGKKLCDMQGPLRGEVSTVCVTKDGKIVSGSNDKTVRVWDIELLSRIVRLDQDQALALWELLHNISRG